MIFKLTDLALLKVSGDDASTFLQGQLTNDINELNNAWHYSGYCNPKGRLFTIFTVWKIENTYYLLLPSSLIESIKKRLTMFVMRSNVIIEQANSASFYGILCADIVKKLMPSYSETNNNSLFTSKHDSLLKINQRFLFVSEEISPEIKHLMLEHQKPVPEQSDRWNTLNINEGIPQIYPETSELFIPQTLNLDLIGGISYKKGCYTGQEIVARMHYLGKLKQRMYRVNINEETTIRANDKIVLQNNPSKTVGRIVCATQKNKQQLAVLRHETLTERLALEDGSQLHVDINNQPYPITTN